MAYLVVGKRTGKFVAKDTGELKEFGKLFVTFPADGTDGLECEVVGLRPLSMEHVHVGDEVRFDRNQYGRVQSVEVIKSASYSEKFEQILDSASAGSRSKSAG